MWKMSGPSEGGKRLTGVLNQLVYLISALSDSTVSLFARIAYLPSFAVADNIG